MPDNAVRTRRRGTYRRVWRAGATQLACAVVGFIGGLLIVRVSLPPTMPTSRAFDVLMTFGFGVLGIAMVIFSLLFLVVQWAASHLTPRLNLFRDDPVVWRTFAYVVGVFAFCLTAALGIGRDDSVSAVIPIAAMVLVLVAIELILRLQSRAFASIQLAPSLAEITGYGTAGLPPPDQAGVVAPALTGVGRPVLWPGTGTVLQGVRAERLAELARSADAVIVLRRQVGETLLPGTVVAEVHGAAPIGDDSIRRALWTGLERVFGQDCLLGFRLLADIGLRALSPAVNDPATAVQAIDSLHELFLPITGRLLGDRLVTDPAGAVRVVVAMPAYEHYLRTGLDDIMAARGRSPMVAGRLRALLVDLRSRAAPDQERLIDARLAELDRG